MCWSVLVLSTQGTPGIGEPSTFEIPFQLVSTDIVTGGVILWRPGLGALFWLVKQPWVQQPTKLHILPRAQMRIVHSRIDSLSGFAMRNQAMGLWMSIDTPSNCRIVVSHPSSTHFSQFSAWVWKAKQLEAKIEGPSIFALLAILGQNVRTGAISQDLQITILPSSWPGDDGTLLQKTGGTEETAGPDLWELCRGGLKYPTQGFARKVRQPTQVRQKHFGNAEHWSTINSCW